MAEHTPKEQADKLFKDAFERIEMNREMRGQSYQLTPPGMQPPPPREVQQLIDDRSKDLAAKTVLAYEKIEPQLSGEEKRSLEGWVSNFKDLAGGDKELKEYRAEELRGREIAPEQPNAIQPDFLPPQQPAENVEPQQEERRGFEHSRFYTPEVQPEAAPQQEVAPAQNEPVGFTHSRFYTPEVQPEAAPQPEAEPINNLQPEQAAENIEPPQEGRQGFEHSRFAGAQPVQPGDNEPEPQPEPEPAPEPERD